MELTQNETIIEALLFAAGEAVEEKALKSILGQDGKTIEECIKNINEKNINENRALIVRKLDNGYQMCTNPKYHEYISKMLETKQKQELSQAAMETLAIVAYKQPVTRQEIEKIRGVNSDHSVGVLAEYGLIEDIGRKEAPGRPLIYGTTREFLRVFGYSALTELPNISMDLETSNIS